MTTSHAYSLVYLSVSGLSSNCQRRKSITRAVIDKARVGKGNISFQKLLITTAFVEDNVQKSCCTTSKNIMTFENIETNVTDPMVMTKMYVIMEAVADRIQMHKNIGDQRSNWNSLLLASTNSIILGAATLSGIAAATRAVDSPLLALKISSCLMYIAVTALLVIMSVIQPSQLAEEQRNATRLFKKLYSEISTIIAIGSPTTGNVDHMIEKVLALDRAFPLPLLGKMLNKFPPCFEPAVWWPKNMRKQCKLFGSYESVGNGWNEKLEEEMKGIVSILGKNDKADYIRLGEKALKFNKVLAFACPLLTSLAAISSAFVGCPNIGTLGCVIAVAAGAMASVINTVDKLEWWWSCIGVTLVSLIQWRSLLYQI